MRYEHIHEFIDGTIVGYGKQIISLDLLLTLAEIEGYSEEAIKLALIRNGEYYKVKAYKRWWVGTLDGIRSKLLEG